MVQELAPAESDEPSGEALAVGGSEDGEVSPTIQDPKTGDREGGSSSREGARRLALLNHANETGAWIIEDDYDSEFRYRGRPLPALSALDSERRVFYVGTFSKSMFAAMRLGYVVVPPGFVEPFAKARNLLGQSSSAVVEQALARFMADGRFVEHIRRMRRLSPHQTKTSGASAIQAIDGIHAASRSLSA